MKTHVAMFLVAGVLSTGPVAAQGERPAKAQGTHDAATQGLTDAPFASMMVKHHQDGIEMARVEEERGASASVKALAARIRQAQEKDVPELKTHAGRNPGPTGTSGGADHAQMMEQQSQAMMARLKSESGPGLDHVFLEEMSKHHEQAISMTEGAKLQDPDLKKLAQRMLAGQRQELAELKKQLSAHAK